MDRSPLIWALTGTRAGDNAQVLALADMVAAKTAATVMEIPLRYNALRMLPNNLIPAGPRVVAADFRKGLAPPWPELVIGVGRRPVPVARWIGRQSGGRARLVWLGRPRAPLGWFDLVLTTAQYGLPEEANVRLLDLPFARAPEAADPGRWKEKFSALPRPWTAVLVGGERWPVRFDARDAARLGRAVEAERARTGGSWIVSTSPRTGARVARALHENLKKPGYFYYWRAGMAARDNPHLALLALADRFIVTADSASMIAEAVRSRRPVALARMHVSPLAPRWSARKGLARLLAREGIVTPPRDMEAFCRRLVRSGLASWLGREAAGPVSGWRERRLEEAVDHIAKWLEN